MNHLPTHTYKNRPLHCSDEKGWDDDIISKTFFLALSSLTSWKVYKLANTHHHHHPNPLPHPWVAPLNGCTTLVPSIAVPSHHVVRLLSSILPVYSVMEKYTLFYLNCSIPQENLCWLMNRSTKPHSH